MPVGRLGRTTADAATERALREIETASRASSMPIVRRDLERPADGSVWILKPAGGPPVLRARVGGQTVDFAGPNCLVPPPANDDYTTGVYNRFRSGDYYFPANHLVVFPMVLGWAAYYSKLCLNIVDKSGTNNKIRAGLYYSTARGGFGTLHAETQELTPSANGFTELNWSPSGNLWIAAALWFIGVMCKNAGTVLSCSAWSSSFAYRIAVDSGNMREYVQANKNLGSWPASMPALSGLTEAESVDPVRAMLKVYSVP